MHLIMGGIRAGRLYPAAVWERNRAGTAYLRRYASLPKDSDVISCLLNKIRPALRTMYAHLPMPSWNTDFLTALRALEYTVPASLTEPELQFAPIFRNIKTHPHIRLVFLITFSDVL